MKEYNEHVVETLDDAGCIIANKNIIIDNLQAKVAELTAEVERLKAALTQFLDQEGNPPEDTGEWRFALQVLGECK